MIGRGREEWRVRGGDMLSVRVICVCVSCVLCVCVCVVCVYVRVCVHHNVSPSPLIPPLHSIHL